MGKLVKFALLAVGAWLVYRWVTGGGLDSLGAAFSAKVSDVVRSQAQSSPLSSDSTDHNLFVNGLRAYRVSNSRGSALYFGSKEEADAYIAEQSALAANAGATFAELFSAAGTFS